MGKEENGTAPLRRRGMGLCVISGGDGVLVGIIIGLVLLAQCIESSPHKFQLFFQIFFRFEDLFCWIISFCHSLSPMSILAFASSMHYFLPMEYGIMVKNNIGKGAYICHPS